MAAATYRINEVFYSVQGEGVRAGCPSLFLRFSKCNLLCTVETHGFDCDTEFESGEAMRLDEIIAELDELSENCRWVVLTGGEPALQVDEALIEGLHEAGYSLAIETNGTVELPEGLDWITVSPKVPEEAIRQRTADEVKYVRTCGQPIPRTVVVADHYLISPAFDGDELDRETLEWCLRLVRENPQWRLSVQQHKAWGVR
jgi:7-carboxy-7-deazaguanine synthase